MTGERTTVRVQPRGDHERRCPLCREGLDGGGVIRCRGCGAALHLTCCRELGGCATLGCEMRRPSPSERESVLPDELDELDTAGAPRDPDVAPDEDAGERPARPELEGLAERLAAAPELQPRGPWFSFAHAVVAGASAGALAAVVLAHLDVTPWPALAVGSVAAIKAGFEQWDFWHGLAHLGRRRRRRGGQTPPPLG